MSHRSPFLRKTFLWVTFFALAMGFLETSVVVYLRALLYPRGFAFPLTVIPQALAATEVLREAATLVMLVAIGVLAGHNRSTRFAYFLYAFAVWDLAYYLFLKGLLGWPVSWFTWDILFLIPVTWVGPVIAPVLVSLTMIFLACLLLHYDHRWPQAHISRGEVGWLILGSLVLLVTFALDYSSFILEHYSFGKVWSAPSQDLLTLAQNYVPRRFNWWLFGAGELLLLFGILTYWRRMTVRS